MKIAISGSSGFIGRHLCRHLLSKNHEVVPLVRDRQKEGIFWNPDNEYIDTDSLNGVDAIFNLAGESVAQRWTPERKSRIYSSRIGCTSTIVAALPKLNKPVSVLISASAIGYYGNRGVEVLTEDSYPGDTYLARVCVDWEAAAANAVEFGTRCVIARLGIVLSTTGGALPKIMEPFKIGAGGRLGTGRQFMSWISIVDALNAMEFSLNNENLSGPVNMVAPQPLTNLEFAETVGSIMGKPALMHVPAAMAYMAFGNEMADEVLLISTRAVPEKLSSAGFHFSHSNLKSALHDLVDQFI